MKALFILNDAPYGSERVCNGLRLAGSLSKREGVEVKVGKPAAFDGEGGCFVETDGGKAGFGKGNFDAEPLPQVKLQPPGRHWHAGKVLFEKDWLRRWF